LKYSIGVKATAIFLAACMLVVAAASALGIIFLGEMGLYASDLEVWQNDYLSNKAYDISHRILERYTARTLGQCTTRQLSYTSRNFTDEELSSWYVLDPLAWDYEIRNESGRIVKSTFTDRLNENAISFKTELSCEYPIHILGSDHDPELIPDWEYRDYYCDEEGEHYLYYVPSPVYTVTIRILPDGISTYDGLPMSIIQSLHALRFWIIGTLIGSFLLFAALAVYLCWAAGHSPKHEEIRPGGLNRLPLDLYLAFSGGCFIALLALAVWIIDIAVFAQSNNIGAIVLVGVIGVVDGAILIGFAYACAAQGKMKDHYWWRHTIVGRIFHRVGLGIRFCWRGARKLFRLLPFIWQWLLTALAMVLIPLVLLLLTASTYGLAQAFWALWFVASCFGDLAMVCYGAYAFGILYKSASRIAQGQLDVQVSEKYLFGSFLEFARQLNAAADAAMLAAQKQMKSERMKTELITNVSHDIKTPLTSLINYVDLLEKPHTEEEGVQYLEVLSRQSLRLKKLVDDLMDMSKASTGNLPTEITQVDAVEAVNQALGEFSDKLTLAGLTPVFRQPEEPITMLADGRLCWRVLSNLLSNIVKYALPGTRVYVDLVKADQQVLISLKNISREELNVSADELTERFVRGDTSRNTDGSGLGLNIAKSLMELQHGHLELLVDGDLFKVTLCFPAVS